MDDQDLDEMIDKIVGSLCGEPCSVRTRPHPRVVRPERSDVRSIDVAGSCFNF
jgi:hypothetical protein